VPLSGLDRRALGCGECGQGRRRSLGSVSGASGSGWRYGQLSGFDALLPRD